MTDPIAEEARDENGERLVLDEDKRRGGGTLSDILAQTHANAEVMWRHQETARAELEAHRAECVADECRRCDRTKCYRCEKIKQGSCPLCEACRDAERFTRARSRAFATIPKRFRWATEGSLATLAERVRLPVERLSAALSWASGLGETPPSLTIDGVTGAGKTSLAVALFAAWFDQYRDEGAWFVPAIELGLARARFALGHDDPPAIAAAVAAPLLILDDLGAEAPMHSDAIRQVLHQRHNDERPTWITTGLARVALSQRYDGGLARRIFEGSKRVTVGP